MPGSPIRAPAATSIHQLVRTHRLIAIFRGVPPGIAPKLAETLHRAGIRLLEVALSDDYGRAALQAVREALGGDMHLGAGTVTSLERARTAHEAGAEFILTPHVVPEVNAYAAQCGLGLISGAMTPTEIQAALAQGSEIVKLFPAGDLGPGYLKSLLGPYPDLPLLVVGNIHQGNLTAFMRAGAVGAGIGSYLTQTDWTEPDFPLLERRARDLLQIVQDATLPGSQPGDAPG